MLTVLVPHITAPVADPGSFTYPASAPVAFNAWAQTINNQALDYRWVPFDPANPGGTDRRLPGPPARHADARVAADAARRHRWRAARSPTSWTPATRARESCPAAARGERSRSSRTAPARRRLPTCFPTITGLTDFVTGSPPSISATLFQARPLQLGAGASRTRPAAVCGHSVAVTQSRGPAEPTDTTRRTASGRRRPRATCSLPRGTIACSPSSPGRTATATRTMGSRALYLFNVTGGGPNLLGLAPGMALPGAPSLVLYGTGFVSTMSVSVAGPVYSLSDTTFSNPLCNLTTGTCAQAIQPASLGSSSLAFALPSSLAGGYYLVRSRTSSGTLSAGGKWLQVNVPSKTVPPVPPNQHNMANFILPGQTITGTFTAGGDTTGAFGDYNTFFFYGTAGTVINASVSRVDTSKPWEDPSELDPQLEIIAPDGLIYDNLWKADDQPGLDYNASLSGAVLPLTGTYYLRAETLKGSGAYQASLSFTTVARRPIRLSRHPVLRQLQHGGPQRQREHGHGLPRSARISDLGSERELHRDARERRHGSRDVRHAFDAADAIRRLGVRHAQAHRRGQGADHAGAHRHDPGSVDRGQAGGVAARDPLRRRRTPRHPAVRARRGPHPLVRSGPIREASGVSSGAGHARPHRQGPAHTVLPSREPPEPRSGGQTSVGRSQHRAGRGPGRSAPVPVAVSTRAYARHPGHRNDHLVRKPALRRGRGRYGRAASADHVAHGRNAIDRRHDPQRPRRLRPAFTDTESRRRSG